MGEDNRPKLSKCSEHSLLTKVNIKTNGNTLRTKYSSWGSQIVKGFTTEKKSKQQTSIPNKKLSLTRTEVSDDKNKYLPYHSRVKRSLISDFPCSANAAQVHPHVFDCNRITSPTSHDLFLELDHLRELLRESKERELALQSELLQHNENPRILELVQELDSKRIDLEQLISRVSSLEAEKTSLSEQLASLSSILPRQERSLNLEGRVYPASDTNAETTKPSYKSLEVEVVELRRINKELQFQKRNLAFQLSSVESELAALAKVTESDIVAKVQAEASFLRDKNENLSKQVEGLQMSRLNEVEELAYLRWVNSCLRHELCNSDKTARLELDLNDGSECIRSDIISENKNNHETFCSPNRHINGGICQAQRTSHVKKNSSNNSEDNRKPDYHMLDKDWIEAEEYISPRRRHSISGCQGYLENLTVNKRRQSDSFICRKEINNESPVPRDSSAVRDKNLLLAHRHDLIGVQSPRLFATKSELCKFAALDIEKRTLRIPKPPPRPSTSVADLYKGNKPVPIPPPPPPPPPPLPKFSKKSTGVMQRAPQVAELYHSLMKRDSKKDSSGGGTCDAASVANVHSSMIGEIENRSSHLLAIKADVETQGEFVKSLIKEVNDAAYDDIEDVVAFVRWLDDELCFLVDERAVLKHFDWPEKKADTLREAAFGYLDLKKLEYEVSNYEDDPHLPCDTALKKMVALSEKMERSVYNLLRTRDVMVRSCKEFQIPTDWMLDSGIISKIKFGSVRLAEKYMKRVATELKVRSSNKDPTLEYMLLQGVRFAFRIHQFAGGFDSETMHVFEELRNLAYVRKKI